MRIFGTSPWHATCGQLLGSEPLPIKLTAVPFELDPVTVWLELALMVAVGMVCDAAAKASIAVQLDGALRNCKHSECNSPVPSWDQYRGPAHRSPKLLKRLPFREISRTPEGSRWASARKPSYLSQGASRDGRTKLSVSSRSAATSWLPYYRLPPAGMPASQTGV